MTTAAQQREADRATQAFHIALTAIGVETLSDAIVLWDSVPAAQRASKTSEWLGDAVALVMGRRALSVALARAYYRLVRALLTGTTVPDPNTPEPQFVSLSKLRSEFAKLAGPRQPDGQGSDLASGPDGRIEVEKTAPTDNDKQDAQAAEDEARILLDTLGPRNYDKMVREIDPGSPAREVDAARRDAHNQAGARQAATAERIAMNGGRSALWRSVENDKRAIGYVRMSTTGTPCGWCAMLISRGPVYASERSATYKGAASYEDGDKYHDNCHCIAVPVFTTEQYDKSSLFDLNRQYSVLWPQVTRGLSGKAAISAWRRYIRQQHKTSAQEALTPRLAQEA